MAKTVEAYLKEKKVRFDKSYIDNGRLMVRFPSVADQLAARDDVNEKFQGTYITALSFAPRTRNSCAPWVCGRCRWVWTCAADSIFCTRSM